MPPKYKPGGKKFPPRATTNTNLPKQVIKDPSSASSELPASGSLDQDAENQFELELCWCIQHLQINLQSKKLSDKHSLHTMKTLYLLKNDTVPLIRKRQAMRNTFGDYRAKMSLDERTHGRYLSNFKFAATKVDSNKSVFLKKATLDSAVNDSDKESSNGEATNSKKTFVMNKQVSEVPFRFNFSVPEA